MDQHTSGIKLTVFGQFSQILIKGLSVLTFVFLILSTYVCLRDTEILYTTTNPLPNPRAVTIC